MAVYRLDDDSFAFPPVEEAVEENDYWAQSSLRSGK